MTRRIPTSLLLTLWACMLIGFFDAEDWRLKAVLLLIAAVSGTPVFIRIDRAYDLTERLRAEEGIVVTILRDES